VHVFAPAGAFLTAHRRADVCGIAPDPAGFVITDGLGGIGGIDAIDGALRGRASLPRAWDNHLIRVRPE